MEETKEVSNSTDRLADERVLPAVKGGRCFNASHRDRGVVVHAVKAPINPNSYWGGKAACGTETGRRSYGWSETKLEINCPRCLKKLAS